VIKSFGLTHLALAVRDVERAFRFYEQVFGMTAYFREPGCIHATTPGCRDVLTFNERPEQAGQVGGVAHFGFRLQSPADIDEAVREALAAGGTLLRRGEFAPGYPFAYVADPDGYEVEIWYE
jgi:catechol 2,3-dioxygenase-like lactoylglutathione lyase family enzyme